MQYAGYVVYIIALMVTLFWMFGLRLFTQRGTPPMKPTINTTMLFVVWLIVIPGFSFSLFHLLWLFPVSFLVGMLSLSMPFALLSIPGHLFYQMVCIGLDFEETERNRVRVCKLQELIIEDGLTAEQARERLMERGEW